jgi:Uma2 family endonuclease
MRSATHNKDAEVGPVDQAVTVHLKPVVDLTPDRFFELAGINKDLRMELTAEGELIVMPPAGGETGNRNATIAIRLGVWAEQDNAGIIFDSSTGFTLPNGAVRSPDASWVERSKWEALTNEQRKKFVPLCPDFVIELRSPTDSLSVLRDKMQEYLDNGAKLGWLIDPEQKRVYVYRPRSEAEELHNPEKIPGDPILSGFTLDLREIW